MATREAAMEALLAKLTAAYSFGVVTRRVDSPETLATPGEPGLGLVVHSEIYENRPPSPRKLTMRVLAIVYIDVTNSANAIPDAVLNPIKDAIDTALLPDNKATNLCTLGGVVFSCFLRGEVIQAPGDKTGKGLAVMPIEIILP